MIQRKEGWKIETIFNKEDIVSSYSTKEAIEDGSLFDLTCMTNYFKRSMVNIVTASLMGKGYLNKDGSPNISNIFDLVSQANRIVYKKKKVFNGEDDWFFSGNIELPSGEKQKIYICLNDTGLTAMLPEDY